LDLTMRERAVDMIDEGSISLRLTPLAIQA